MNMLVQINLDSCFTFGTRGGKSWFKSRNFTILAFLAIFDKIIIFLFRAKF